MKKLLLALLLPFVATAAVTEPLVTCLIYGQVTEYFSLRPSTQKPHRLALVKATQRPNVHAREEKIVMEVDAMTLAESQEWSRFSKFSFYELAHDGKSVAREVNFTLYQDYPNGDLTPESVRKWKMDVVTFNDGVPTSVAYEGTCYDVYGKHDLDATLVVRLRSF